MSGHSESLGYVLCFNLERGGSPRSQVPSTQPIAAQSRPPATVVASFPTSVTTASPPPGITSGSAGLTNSDVLDMYKSGLRQDVLVAKIKSSHCNFDTSPSQLKQLKATGLGDAVILAMVEVPTAHAPTSDAEEIKQTERTKVLLSEPAKAPVQEAAPVQQGAPKQAVIKDGKHRLFVTDDPMVEHYAFSKGSSVAAANSHSAAAASSQTGFESNPNGKVDPRTVEIQADLWKFCPALIVTSNIQNADYILWFRRNDHHRTKMFLLGGVYGLAFSAHQKVNGASVFTATGDMIYATKESTVDKTLKDVCSNVKW
jgi:hypothetical protein